MTIKQRHGGRHEDEDYDVDIYDDEEDGDADADADAAAADDDDDGDGDGDGDDGDYGDYGDCGDCAGDEPTFHWTDKSIVLASDHPRLSIVPFWSPPAHHKIPELQLSITCGNW